MKILLTSVGRRVELVRCIRESIADAKVYGADYFPLSPALNVVDEKCSLPLSIDESYFQQVYNICKVEKIDLIIPLIDKELLLYSKSRSNFLDNGIMINISPYETVLIFRNKYKMYKEILSKGLCISQPYTSMIYSYSPRSVSTNKVILKPISGSSSIGHHVVDRSRVEDFFECVDLNSNEYLIQEYIEFSYEVTVDVFVGSDGRIIEFCQRKRLKTRGGEVSQGVTIYDEKISIIIDALVSSFSFYGIINVQVMFFDGAYYLTEVNLRFGGGFPLSYKAGAKMIDHFINEPKTPIGMRYKEGVNMSRYDSAFYK